MEILYLLCDASCDMSSKRFPYKFIDVHCHLLPGVDDGSKDINMSVDMAKQAAKENIDAIIVTPHNKTAQCVTTPDEIRKRVAELQCILTDEGIDIRLYPGNELFYDCTLPERLSRGEALCLADSEYCLVEFHPLDDFNYISNGLQSLMDQGFSPVLAHCERYACLVNNNVKVEMLARQGTLFQVNAASVPKCYLQRIPAFVNWLIKKDLVSFIATDAHRSDGIRGPKMLGSADYLRKKFSPVYVYNLLRGNAERLLPAQDA